MDEKRMDRLEEQVGAVREDLGSFKVDTSRQFEALREDLASFKVETSRQFEAAREDLASFKVETSLRFEAAREDLGSFKVGVSRQFEEVRTEIRLTRVVQEGLHSKIQVVAEAVAGTNERLDQQQAELRKTYQEISEMLRPVYELLGPKNIVISTTVWRCWRSGTRRTGNSCWDSVRDSEHGSPRGWLQPPRFQPIAASS